MDGAAPALRDTLERDAWFRGISKELQTALVSAGRIQKFNAGELIYAAGDQPDGLYAILSGEVRLLYYSIEGKYAFYYVGQPSFWFGALSELDGQERFTDAVAHTDATLLQVNHATIKRWLTSEPRFWWDFTKKVCSDLRNTLWLLAESNAMSPRVKAAQLLASLASRRAADEGRQLNFTQEQLAAKPLRPRECERLLQLPPVANMLRTNGHRALDRFEEERIAESWTCLAPKGVDRLESGRLFGDQSLLDFPAVELVAEQDQVLESRRLEPQLLRQSRGQHAARIVPGSDHAIEPRLAVALHQLPLIAEDVEGQRLPQAWLLQ